MVRTSSSKKPPIAETPEATERKRLKKLALKNNLLSDTPATPKSYVPLSPSKLVMKHHGKDILRKSQRKNRFLFSFPGLLAPISGGKIGELKNLGSKNPILYLDFPQGQMKLFGTIVYPKNRYLTLLFSRGGKNVMCEDYFDNMIVFSDAWWIGKKDENPEEARLDFPKELCQGQQMEYDFKGGAGVESVNKQDTPRTEIKQVEIESLDNESGDALSDDDNDLTAKMEVTPTRHSARNAGKRFKFAEASSEDDPVRSDAEPSDGEEKKVGKKLHLTENDTIGKTISSASLVLKSDAAEDSQIPEQIQTSLTSVSKSRKISKSTVTVTKSKENSKANRGSLVQPTISTLFKKVGEKKGPRGSDKSSSTKVLGKKLQSNNYKRKIDQTEGSSKKGKVNEEKTTGTGIKRKKKESEDEEDIEEISSTSEDANGSDEDWTA
ncbi:Root hair initiation protein root hairless 1, putative isoform 2 [Theobroma cacao]|uniref:Root hair initiation protein root hairless 1, putative isoform 2 n=1 Tax=Theobroma cacao TaxID=3641 RepID=A0A061EXP0_THECC|nr:Root hair initiation protein root hairless 1, putative isoform 2 [Theobroma cacao]